MDRPTDAECPWDFDLSAARQKLASSGATSGIKLELPWPATPPEANKLHLFVRYETADGLAVTETHVVHEVETHAIERPGHDGLSCYLVCD